MTPRLVIEGEARPPRPLPPCRYRFPDPRRAGPEGLVAVGADFAPETILEAYRRGLFPWPHNVEEFAWFSPDPRAIIPVGGLHVSRRLERTLRQGRFRFSIDCAFPAVVKGCAQRREGTWITRNYIDGYLGLHEAGRAHSIEAWTLDGTLAGGLYGVRVGGMFGAESMFHTVTDASKAAMVAMMQWAEDEGIELVDIQVLTPHTASMGGVEIPRDDYLRLLNDAIA